MPEEYEILEPLPDVPQESFWKKHGPLIFWGTMVAMPIMNLGASYFDYKTAKLQVELENLRAAAEKV